MLIIVGFWDIFKQHNLIYVKAGSKYNLLPGYPDSANILTGPYDYANLFHAADWICQYITWQWQAGLAIILHGTGWLCQNIKCRRLDMPIHYMSQTGSTNILHANDSLCLFVTVQSGEAISLCINLTGLGGSQSGAALITYTRRGGPVDDRPSPF